MDWLQFASSVISSLAWPAVVAYLLFLLRAQLSSLARRLTELSLPGGAKASFREDLEGAKTTAITIAAKAGNADFPQPEQQENGSVSLDNRKRIERAFDRTVDFMKSKIDHLPLSGRKELGMFILSEIKQGGIDEELYDLYYKLRDMSEAANKSAENTIKDDEAIEFERLCSFLQDRFVEAFNKWRPATQARQEPVA